MFTHNICCDCRRRFSWHTIQQLGHRSSKHCTWLCCCYSTQLLVLVQLQQPTEIRLSELVLSCYLLTLTSLPIKW